MLYKLFLAFTLVPVIELYVLITVGGIIGAASTIGIVLLTGAVGAWMAKAQGSHTLRRMRESLYQGKMPADELLDAVIITAAGILLLTPGFFTDAAGITLLVPPCRALVKRRLRARFDRYMLARQAQSGQWR